VITDVPADRPVTIPPDDPNAATPVLLLLQVPPKERSLSVTEEPAHTEVAPEITDGNVLTVIRMVV
jgi:hypothetical protein